LKLEISGPSQSVSKRGFMSRFIYFLQSIGLRKFLMHLAVGISATCIFTSVGIVFDRFQVLGGYAARLFLWQSYLLWSLVGRNFIEHYEGDIPVYAGLPFAFVSIIGILSGVPIYTFLSMMIHYVLYSNDNE